MPRNKKEKELKWRFYWKNIDGLGRFNRLVGGLLLLALAWSVKDDLKKAVPAGLMGVDLIAAGLLRWCPLRAFLKRPTWIARRRRLAEGA